MKFENIKSSKFNQFEKCQIQNLAGIVGGKVAMSSSNGGTDSADLTGSGATAQWDNITWAETDQKGTYTNHQ